MREKKKIVAHDKVHQLGSFYYKVLGGIGMDEKNKQFVDNIIILSFPVISYLLLGPLEFYFGNRKDLSFEVIDFLPFLIALSILILLLGSLCLRLLGRIINKWINILIVGVSICSYIQNMFMNIKLSEANGAPLRYETLGHFPIINFMIWIFV